MNKVAIIYWSSTGNTEKVAYAVKMGLEDAGADVLLKKADKANQIDFFDFDLICIGSPSINWHPAEPLDSFLRTKFKEYRKEGRIKPKAPKIPGKNVLIFCTYSGPHTGIDEAIPAVKYIAQFFEHLGFSVLSKWYILSEHHESKELSTKGRMGDIRGLPSEEDLQRIRENSKSIFSKLIYLE